MTRSIRSTQRNYDVTPDGKQLLIVLPAQSAERRGPPDTGADQHGVELVRGANSPRTASVTTIGGDPIEMSQTAAPLPPHARIMQMATGHVLARLVYAAAKFGIADHLADSPKSAAEIAAGFGTNATRLPGRSHTTMDRPFDKV